MKRNSIIKVLLFSLLLAAVLAVSVSATTVRGSISTKQSSIYVGSKIDVTVKFAATGGSMGYWNFSVDYDPRVLECVSLPANASGGGGKITVLSYLSDAAGNTSCEYKFTFKGLSIANTTVRVSPVQFVDAATDQPIAGVNSSERSIKVEARPAASTENRLASLSVSPGELTPVFGKDVTDYTVTVPFETKEIVVSAEVLDKTAKVELGNLALQVGENLVPVYVTAQNGQMKTYNLKVTRLESSFKSPEVTVGDKKFTVSNDTTAIQAPAGFTSSSSSYNQQDILVYQSQDEKVKLAYLQNAEGGNWYVYIPESETFAEFVTFEGISRGLSIIPFPSSISLSESLIKTTTEKDGKSFEAYKLPDSDDFIVVVYGVTTEGESGLYFFNVKNGDFIKYFEADTLASASEDSANELEKANKKLLIAEIVAASIGIMFFILLIALIMLARAYKAKSAPILPPQEEILPPPMQEKDELFSLPEEEIPDKVKKEIQKMKELKEKDIEFAEQESVFLSDDEYFLDKKTMKKIAKSNKDMNK